MIELFTTVFSKHIHFSNEQVSSNARVVLFVLFIPLRKKGKKLKEKRRKERLRRQQSGGGPNVDTSNFIGIEYEDSIFTPWLNEDGSLKEKDEAV